MAATGTSPLAPGAPVTRAVGADLRGWSVLPLLAGESSVSGSWLFVTAASEAWLSRGALCDAQFVQVPIDERGAWPFESGTLGGTVIDAEVFGRNGQRIARVLDESIRVTRTARNVMVVCRHRYVPRKPGAWREYGRPSAERWKHAAGRFGTGAFPMAFATRDGDRITRLTLSPEDARDLPDSTADRVVLGLDRTTRPGGRVLDELIACASREAGSALRIDNVRVRKIGKTAVFVSDASRRRFITRIARSPIALSRGARNFEALESLHRSGLPESIRARAPQPVGRGSHAGYPFFVETCLDGAAGPRPGSRVRQGWIVEAAEYVGALHGATQHRVPMNTSALARLVHEPIARVDRGCASVTATQVLGFVERSCVNALRDRALPLVLSHGDFTDSNCLFDAEGRLAGVVDWEVSAPRALPLLDLLQLMPVPHETSAAPRWQRFDAWMQLLQQPQRASADPVIGPYLQTLDIPAPAVPGLILMQWVTHVADRVEARRDDERWMRLRVWQPLETLESLLRN